MKTIILRHDFDWDDGLDDGVSIIIDIEKKYNVRSTIFLRYDRNVSDNKYKQLYQELELQGWEFGLHLANHEGKPEYTSPYIELETVRGLGLNICGVSACGGTYKWLNPYGWVIQDSLGLKYIAPSTLPMPDGYKLKSIIVPDYLMLDGRYLYRYGAEGYDKYVEDFTIKLEQRKAFASLSHNRPFYRLRPNQKDGIIQVTNTLYYDRFIEHFKRFDDIQFKTFKEYLSL